MLVICLIMFFGDVRDNDIGMVLASTAILCNDVFICRQ